MKNENIIKMLPKESFVIWGSQAIAKQNKLFDRKCKDYDIMLSSQTFSIYKPFFETQWTIDQSKYWKENIYIINFDDWSNIDCIIAKEPTSNIIDWYKYLWIEDIILYKIDLIKNNINVNISIDNKHTKDLIFLIDKNNRLKYTEYYNIEPKAEMPF